jgi:hypothetical protein
MLAEFLTKCKVKRQLRELLRADAKGELSPPPKTKSGRFEFVFTLIRADTPEQLSASISVVSDAAIAHGAVIFGVVGPLIIMAFGTHGPVQDSPVPRRNLVRQIQERLGNNVKTVHGATEGHFGLFGDNKRINYTFEFRAI